MCHYIRIIIRSAPHTLGNNKTEGRTDGSGTGRPTDSHIYTATGIGIRIVSSFAGPAAAEG